MDKKEWFIDSHNGNIKDDYHFIEKIASGGFGIVYLAEHRKTSTTSFSRFHLILTSKNSTISFCRVEVCNQGHSKEKSEGLHDLLKRD